MPISTQGRQQIAAAINRAEQVTSGEIVCVVAKSSSNYNAIPLLWAIAAALALPWPLAAFTALSVQRIDLLQLFTFFGLLTVLMIPRIRMWLVPRSLARRRAHHAAMEQFMIRGLSMTTNRTGVLIFMSIAERYARIVADVGIAAKVPQHVWDQAIKALVQQAADGDVTTAMVQAIEICSGTLAQVFPKEAEAKNQLPDRVYVI
jgi:putative membrane protein